MIRDPWYHGPGARERYQPRICIWEWCAILSRKVPLWLVSREELGLRDATEVLTNNYSCPSIRKMCAMF